MTSDGPDKTTWPQSGGCLCGRVRYRLTAAPKWTGYCHCQSCRRATAGVAVAYGGFVREAVEITGDPVHFTSSPGVTRSFCPACGTPLTYESTRWPDEIHILVGSMDNPAACPPANHYYANEQISWLELADHLPRHTQPAG
ncbi:MAG: GFA family protein [Dongiaceae bacterium]